MSAQECSCSARVTVWADGFGMWHAAVPDTSGAARLARTAIRGELLARGEIGTGYRLTLERRGLVGSSTCHPRREYVEAAS